MSRVEFHEEWFGSASQEALAKLLSLTAGADGIQPLMYSAASAAAAATNGHAARPVTPAAAAKTRTATPAAAKGTAQARPIAAPPAPSCHHASQPRRRSDSSQG